MRIIEAFVVQRLAALRSNNSAVSSPQPQLSEAERLKVELLEQPVLMQKYIMGHFWSLARGMRVIGPVHPMTNRLLQLTEEEILQIVVALEAQRRAVADKAATTGPAA